MISFTVVTPHEQFYTLEFTVRFGRLNLIRKFVLGAH